MTNTNDEKRKTRPEPASGKKKSSRLISPGIFLLSAVLACGILFWSRPTGFQQQEFVLGEPALRSYFSPMSFSFVDEEKTEAIREETLRHLPPVYRIDSETNKEMFGRVDGFFKVVSEIRAQPQQTDDERWKALPFMVPEKTREALFAADEIESVKAQVMSVMEQDLVPGLLSQEDRRKLLDAKTQSILLVDSPSSQETVKRTNGILTVGEALDQAPKLLDENFAKNKDLKNAALQILREVLSANIVFDEDRDRAFRKKTAAAVVSIEIPVKKNELIVQRGTLVTERIKERLDQVHRKLASQKKWTQVLTGALLVFFVYLLSYFYLMLFEWKFFCSKSKVLLFNTVILLSILLSKVVTMVPDLPIYLMPTTLAALLLTLLAQNRVGILGAIVMTVFGGFLAGFRPDIMLATLLASLAATFLAYRVRKRVHFFRIALGIGFAYFLVIAGFQLAQNTPWREAIQLASFGFLNALVAVIATFLALPILESIFDVVTDVSLLELSDLNHSLIKKMMVETPGTYHHSLVVSTLAENACEKIGAHSLLARVGCYFHDIGKFETPEFFSENQGYPYRSRHDDLHPKDSFNIIVNHVWRGIQLARKHKLKRAIVDFIAEHQGTGVIYFFYKKALDMAAPNEHIRADDFRYPGPKPQSKETAVVLLADSVEAASRALKETGAEAIQQLVRKIINDKFIDGQLDECDLTLRDLHKIQESFIRDLNGIFHTRTNYPPIENAEGSPDLFGKNQFSKFRVDE